MDLLAKRYASPFFLSDEYISQSRFDEFITDMWSIRNDEEIWEFWLHKVDSMSFDEFKAIATKSKEKPVSEAELETIIGDSQQMLSNFDPDRRT